MKKFLRTCNGKYLNIDKIILDMKRDVNETNKIRSQGIIEIEDGYKVKVTKVYNTKKEKCHENHNIRF